MIAMLIRYKQYCNLTENCSSFSWFHAFVGDNNHECNFGLGCRVQCAHLAYFYCIFSRRSHTFRAKCKKSEYCGVCIRYLLPLNRIEKHMWCNFSIWSSIIFNFTATHNISLACFGKFTSSLALKYFPVSYNTFYSTLAITYFLLIASDYT